MSSRVKNALYTKQYNRLKILRLLRQTPLSRASLARLTGLTRAAISLITEDLIAEGMICESSLSTQSSFAEFHIISIGQIPRMEL